MFDIILILFPHWTNDLTGIGWAKRKLITVAPDASFRHRAVLHITAREKPKLKAGHPHWTAKLKDANNTSRNYEERVPHTLPMTKINSSASRIVYHASDWSFRMRTLLQICLHRLNLSHRLCSFQPCAPQSANTKCHRVHCRYAWETIDHPCRDNVGVPRSSQGHWELGHHQFDTIGDDQGAGRLGSSGQFL